MDIHHFIEEWEKLRSYANDLGTAYANLLDCIGVQDAGQGITDEWVIAWRMLKRIEPDIHQFITRVAFIAEIAKLDRQESEKN